MEKTLGEKMVRTSFNPSDDSKVQHIKEMAAEFINYVNDRLSSTEVKDPENAEQFFNQKQKAIDAIELAAMYAVKAATA